MRCSSSESGTLDPSTTSSPYHHAIDDRAPPTIQQRASLDLLDSRRWAHGAPGPHCCAPRRLTRTPPPSTSAAGPTERSPKRRLISSITLDASTQPLPGGPPSSPPVRASNVSCDDRPSSRLVTPTPS